MRPARASFHKGRREVLAAVADLLIPGGDGMPSATEAGAAGRWLDEVLQLRPDFGPPLAAVLDRLIGADPSAALTKLRTDDPAGFGVLAEVVAGGHFLNPKVRSAIRSPRQQSVPNAHHHPPRYRQNGPIPSRLPPRPTHPPT